MTNPSFSSMGDTIVEQLPFPTATSFRQLIEQAPDIIYRVRLWPTLAFEYVNPSVTTLTGYTPEEHYAEPLLANRIVHPDDIGILQALQAGLADKETVEYTIRWVRKDGGILHTQHHCAMIRNAEGQVVAIEGIARDVTRTVAEEAALRQQQAIMEMANDAILIWDAAGRISYWNRGAERLYGWTGAEASGWDVHDLLTTQFTVPLAEIMATLLERGHWQGRLGQRKRDGVRVIVHSRWTVQRDGDGNLAAILEINEDITEQVRVEAELQESEARYRDLYDNSPDMYLSVYPDVRVIRDCNQTLATTLGYTRAELVGQPVTMIYDPDFHAQHYERIFQDYLQVGVIENAEVVLRRKDGRRLDALLTVRLVRDAEGRPLYSRTALRDISKPKAIQNALAASEERLRYALDATSEGVWDWNVQSGAVQYSDQWLRLLGYARDEVPPSVEFWRSIVHPDDMPRVEAGLQAHFDGRTPSYECENRMRMKSGAYRHNLDRGKVVEWDAGGRPLRMVGTDADISTRKQIEEALAGLAAIVESSKDAIIGFDLAGTIISWNRGAEQLYQYPAEEAIGQSVRMLIPEDRVEDYDFLQARIFGSAPTSDYETKRRARDGRLIDVALTISPVHDANGQVVGASTIARDITERKAMDEALRANQAALEQARDAADAANRAKSLFLASMSHEIRTPMNAVTGLTSLLLDTNLTVEQRDFVETIRNSADALLTIINEILDFSKIESGSLELELQPFSLATCIEDALDLFAVKAAGKGIELVYHMAPGTPDHLLGDVTRIRQIIVNLVSNALKFTEAGEIVILVQPEGTGAGSEDTATAGRTLLHFAVRDTGIGIPADRMDRLFRTFSQTDASTTRKYGGTGLGLAISKRLAEMMGGSMWVESVVGVGSTFHFTAAFEPVQVEPEPVKPVDLAGLQVLIVDDNQTNRFILREQTRRWGMQPTAVASGFDALEMFAQGTRFDLLILDMLMPEMNGLQFYAALTQRTGRPLVPAVMLTSLGDNFLREEARDLGISIFVSKPVHQTQLYDILCAAMQARTPIRNQARPEEVYDRSFASRHPLRILLAEDNAINQKVALRILSRLGYTADTAANGIEAVESLERQPYDAILMDMYMPEMDGLEATRAIRSGHPAGQQPVIIAMTAAAMQQDREACLEAGMDDFVSKPIRVEELVRALEQASIGERDCTR